MRTFYVRNTDDNQRLRIYLFLFAEYDGEAEDGWSRYRYEPEHERAFEEYTRRQQARWVDAQAYAAISIQNHFLRFAPGLFA
jgi:hypothetical protein